MSRIVRIPEDHLILVCNSRKALFLKNAGPVAQPELKVDAHATFEWEPEELMNSDRAGRRFDGGAAALSGGARSAMELPDLETRHLEAVAETVLGMLSDRHRQSRLGGLLIVAPPALLGILRRNMTRDLGGIVVGELAKDLAEMPLSDIRKSLLKVF